MKNFLFLVMISITLLSFIEGHYQVPVNFNEQVPRNMVVKTYSGYTCAFPWTVTVETRYMFLPNPKKGQSFDFCTSAYTGPARNWPWCAIYSFYPTGPIDEKAHFSEYWSGFNDVWDWCKDYTYVFGEHKYHFNDDNKKLTFKEAKKICENEGGTLPILARKMDRSAIRKFLRPLLGQFETHRLGYWVSWDDKTRQCFYVTAEGDEKLANCEESSIAGALCSTSYEDLQG